MGLVRREVPFGEPERKTKKSLYRIDDPFFRLWFRVVAPNRALLAGGSIRDRAALLDKHYPPLVAMAWEDLCRSRLPSIRSSGRVGRRGPWKPGSRWWSGSAPGWDIVSESIDGRKILLGEAKWTPDPVDGAWVARASRELERKAPPSLGAQWSDRTFVRALFVPAVRGKLPRSEVLVVTARDLL
jgi:hypothetical protein